MCSRAWKSFMMCAFPFCIGHTQHSKVLSGCLKKSGRGNEISIGRLGDQPTAHRENRGHHYAYLHSSGSLCVKVPWSVPTVPWLIAKVCDFRFRARSVQSHHVIFALLIVKTEPHACCIGTSWTSQLTQRFSPCYRLHKVWSHLLFLLKEISLRIFMTRKW
jgi:hypothetical protein